MVTHTWLVSMNQTPMNSYGFDVHGVPRRQTRLALDSLRRSMKGARDGELCDMHIYALAHVGAEWSLLFDKHRPAC